MSLHPPFLEAAEAWLAGDPDPETRAQLAAVIDRKDWSQLRDLFDGRLEFGTAGMRGVFGPGPQRMNRLLVQKVSAGLAAYVQAQGVAARGVVIGHDARYKSREFAEDTARVLAAAGIRSYLAHRPWPTPTTAWAVVDRGAGAGVMVTASHNPPAYNGYKVYWGNGAQIIPPHDTGIAAAIDAAGPLGPLPSLADARARGLVVDLDEALHDRYLAAVAGLRRTAGARPSHDGRAAAPPAMRSTSAASLVIAYTPLHGVGARSTEPALAQAGYAHVHTEPSQREPDPAFPTVAFPNPEENGAMDRVLALAAKVHADLVLANDPDADRLCVAVPDPAASNGTGYRALTGDQVGALLADYLLEVSPKDRRMVATTVVSSQLLSYLAKATGADYRETLTGFKWIGNAAIDYEREHHGRFVLGYEEALGYSVGPLVRDKDGVSACVIFADLAAWDRARGRSVLEHLDEIYRRVGLFATEQVSITKPGADGIAEIKRVMARFRAEPPAAIAGHAVEHALDLASGEGGLPPSDVLVWRLAGGRRVIMRPSGTEPKLKSYYEVRVSIAGDEPIANARARAAAELAELRDAHQQLI